MKTSDLRPLMVFHPVNDLAGGPDFVIDRLDKGKAFGRWVAVPGGEDAYIVAVETLIDPTKFTFDPLLTAGTMHEMIRHLTLPPGTVAVPILDLMKARRYADDASLGEYGYRDPDGARCIAMLDRYIRPLPERLEAVKPALKTTTEAILSCNGCFERLEAGEMMLCKSCREAMGPTNIEFVYANKDGTYPKSSDQKTAFYVDVGNVPPAEAEELVAKIAADLKMNADGAPTLVDGVPQLEQRLGKLIEEAKLENELTRWRKKASLEKTRRIQLMGRVEELKAALGDARRGFELELPGQWPERFNILLELEPSDPKDWAPRYDYKARPTSPLSWPEKKELLAADEGAHDAKLIKAGLAPEAPDAAITDPFHELSSVLWFLASLTSDHDPGCIVKDGKGEPCDCEVTLREGEPWWRRVRASLRLPSQLKERLLALEERLSHRRVVQARALKGAPGPKESTVYEMELRPEVSNLAVMHYELGSVSPEQIHSFKELFAKKFDNKVLLVCMPHGWELTVLELP